MKPKKRTRLLWLLLLCVMLGLFSIDAGATDQGVAALAVDDELALQNVETGISTASTTISGTATAGSGLSMNHQWYIGSRYTWSIKDHYVTYNGISHPAYCIMPGYSDDTGSYQTYDNLYAWHSLLSADVKNAIALAIAYGYPNQNYDTAAGDTVGYYETQKRCATQALIWEFMNGSRSATYPYTLSLSGAEYYCSSYATLVSVRNQIVEKMKAHGTIPSFASSTADGATTYELSYNASTGTYSTTLTDTNGVLSSYPFTSTVSGLTFSASGNTLTITATASAAAAISNGVTFSGSGAALDVTGDSCLVWYKARPSSSTQAVITLMDNPESFKAYIKLKAASTGSLTLIKSSTNPDMVKNNACYSLEGTTYGLYTDYGCTNQVGTFYVKADGTSNTITGLAAGTYYYKELTAGKGYQLDSTVKSITVVAETTTPIRAADVPTGDPIRIFLEKSNADATGAVSDTPLSLAGAKFSITYYSGMYTSEATAEAAANAGTVQKRIWYITTKPYTSGGVTKYVASMYDNPTGDPLFYDETGSITVPMGTVVVKEVSPPTGYTNSANFYFKKNPTTALGSAVILQFDGSGSAKDLVTGNYMDDLNISIYEGQVKGGVSVQKVDSSTDLSPQGNGTLAGAVFGVYSNSSHALYLFGIEYNKGDLVTTLTTNASGYAATGSQALPYGDYYLQEITPPTGYQLSSEKKTFSISSDGVIVSLGNYSDPVIQGYIQVRKQAVNTVTGSKVPETGATYQVWLKSAGSYAAAQDSQRDTITIGKDGIGTSKALPYGTYCLRQSSGWTGYDPNSTTYEVNITSQGTTVTVDTSGGNLAYENNIWVGSIEIFKVDGDTQQPLAGAEFTLSGTDGTTVVLTTDDFGKVTFPNLYYGVTYTWTETKAPKGYLLDDRNTGTWSVGKQGERLEVTCENYRRPGSITVTKETAENTPLAGVTFLLEYWDGDTWKPVTVRETDTPVTLGATTSSVVDGCLTTDDSGVVTFSGLWADDNLQYRLTEVAAPEGYALLGTTVFEGVLPIGCNAQDTSETPDEIWDETLYFYDLPIIVRNSKVYALPLTGGSGFSFATVGLLVLAIGSLLLGAGTKQYFVKKENNR